MMVRQPSVASYVAKFDSAQDLVNEGKWKLYLTAGDTLTGLPPRTVPKRVPIIGIGSL